MKLDVNYLNKKTIHSFPALEKNLIFENANFDDVIDDYNFHKYFTFR